MFDGLAASSLAPDEVCLHLGIKAFGKLRNSARVQEIWAQTERRGLVNKIIAGARIDAAAELGNFTDAASLLDYMVAANLSVELPVWTSAINACKNAQPPNHVAARNFFEELLTRKLQPNVVTFASLVAAHKDAPLKTVQEIRTNMTLFRVKPNSIFAEVYLGAVCSGRLQNIWKVEDVAERLRGLSPRRLEAAQGALAEFKAANLKLSQLCRFLDEHLQRECA